MKSAAGRLIVNHIGSAERGFLDVAAQVFKCKKDSSDYHSSMDSEIFRNWFNGVLNIIPDKSVIVLDLAPYHRK